MQEEVENRTVNLVISTSRLTARALISGYHKFAEAHKNHSAKRASKGRRQHTGKQTVKQLMRSGKEIRRLPVQETHLHEFEKVIKKYGVDFAVNKGVFEGQPRYLVFFKAKDESVLSDVYKECLAKQLHKEKTQEKKPSVLKSLAHFKEIAAKTPQKMQNRELVR